MSRPFDLLGYSRIREPLLLFHPDRTQDSDTHPLTGLLHFGPFSRALFNSILDPIRIATVFPNGFRKRVLTLFRELEERHYPRERRNDLVEFPGFSRVFGL